MCSLTRASKMERHVQFSHEERRSLARTRLLSDEAWRNLSSPHPDGSVWFGTRARLGCVARTVRCFTGVATSSKSLPRIELKLKTMITRLNLEINSLDRAFYSFIQMWNTFFMFFFWLEKN